MSPKITLLTQLARLQMVYNCDAESGRYDRFDAEAPMRPLRLRARTDSTPITPQRFDGDGMKRLTFQAKR